jgi:superfamily II DNA or RNA helicase
MTKYTLSNFENQVSHKVLSRGRSYFNEGMVTNLDESEPGEWTADVIGSRGSYRINISMLEDKVDSWDCECPDDDYDACKHVVATLMAIKEAKGATYIRRVIAAPVRRRPKPKASPSVVASSEPLPKPLKRGPESLLRAFDLQEDETGKRLLRIAALIWGEFTQTQLLESFNLSGFKHNGVNLNSAAMQPFLITIQREDFLQKNASNQYTLNQKFAQLLCDRDFDSHPDFKQAVTGIRKKMGTGWNYYYNPEHNFREMRIARYENKLDDFVQHYRSVIYNNHQKHTSASLLHFWLGDDFDVQKLESFKYPIRAFLITESVFQTSLHLHAPDGYFHYAMANIDQAGPVMQPVLVVNCLQICLFRGDWQGLGRLKSYLPPNEELEMNGILDLMGGDVSEARQTFESALKWKRQTTGYAKAQLTRLPGVFQVLSYFHGRDAGLYAKAEIVIKASLKAPDLYYPAFNYLQAVLLFLQSEKKASLLHLQNFSNLFPEFQFIKFLCEYWIDVKKVDIGQLSTYYQLAKSNGYRWLAAEMGYLFQQFQPNDAALAVEVSGEIEELGIEPLSNLLPRIEDWENALAVLSQMGNSVKATPKETGKRLIWHVNFRYSRLLPKEQTFSRNGWTSGRSVTFQRLQNQELDCITPQDMRIINAVSFNGSQARLSEQAMKAMVGHPLLFLEQSPDTAIQLQEEKPVLLIQSAKGGYKLKFSHEFSQEGIQVVKESPTRYKLLDISPDYAKIARTFDGNELFVPEKGLDRLKTALDGLAQIITIQSPFDAEDTSLPDVPADSRICVHLLPVGEGFHIELFVKPFTSTHPYFKPGAGESNVVTLLEGHKTRTTRDLSAEKKNESSLRKQVGLFQDKKPKNSIWELEDSEVCLRLLADLEPMVRDQSILLEWPKGEKFRVSMLAGSDAFQMRIAIENDWFAVSGSLKVDEERVITMQELLELSQRNGQFIELSPGRFLALTHEFRRRLAAVNGLFSKGKGNSLKLHPLAASAMEPFTEGLKHLELDKKFKENRQKIQTAFSQKFKLPDNFKATLRAYQLEGYRWLQRCAAAGLGACLADDMGLGKTIQALALLSDRGPKGPALVVAPASVCRNWMTEAAKFAPNLTPILFGDGDRATAIDQAGKNDLIIVTYDLMARESDHLVKKPWTTVLLDEAQSIKNRSTKRSETAMKLQGEFRLIMTGTPLENHLGELWNLFQFINPGLLGTLESFNERFAVPIEKYRDENRQDQLRRLVQPFILRRRKDEVLKELPAKTEITLTVSLSVEERAFYEALRRSALQKLEADDSAGAGEKHLRILAEIMRLRRAACHPKLVDANSGFKESAKLVQFGEIVEELLENKHKALVFSQFVSHLEILETYLKSKKIAYQYLDGSTPLATRQKRIEAFQSGEGDLFLISLKAGGVGLNLTAADYVIHMDPWWNPAVEDQATDRAHRIGQEKPVMVYRLVAEDTIEQKILKLHERKRDLADSLLEGADISARLSADDLLALMRH